MYFVIIFPTNSIMYKFDKPQILTTVHRKILRLKANEAIEIKKNPYYKRKDGRMLLVAWGPILNEIK